MIYSNENNLVFWQHKAKLLDNGEPREVYCNNKQDVENMVNSFARMSNLVWEDVVPDEDQKKRLAVINSLSQENKFMWMSELELFVKEGAILDDTQTPWLLSMQLQYSDSTAQYLSKQKQQKITEFDRQLTAYYDSVARIKNYDNRITCALRAGYAGPFQAEGSAFATWMDDCNVIAYRLLEEVLAGTRDEPTSFDEIKNELPVLSWPA